MGRIYFKQHFESGNVEWTIYGSYCDYEITTDGDIRVLVREITSQADLGHMEYSVYRMYIVPQEVTEITKKEYESVVVKIDTAEDLRYKADEILKSLL